MSYVIGEACLGERYATCVAVCPVDCIHPGDYKGEEFMIIDPDVCIDCGLCLPECPIGAIFETEDESPDWAEINAELSEEFSENDPVEERPRNDPPRKEGHEIVNP